MGILGIDPDAIIGSFGTMFSSLVPGQSGGGGGLSPSGIGGGGGLYPSGIGAGGGLYPSGIAGGGSGLAPAGWANGGGLEPASMGGGGLEPAGWANGGGLLPTQFTGVGLQPSRVNPVTGSAPLPGTPKTPGTPQTPSQGGTGATGTDPGTDKWRGLIDEAAGAYNIDGDAIQAVMMIESGGNPNAISPAGAQGLMQVMPFHFGAGENMLDPRTNVMKGAKILSDNYKRYGNWDSAVAAYLGAVDGQGRPTSGSDVLGTSGIEYAELFNKYYQQIKGARAKAPAGGTGGGSMKSIWGGGEASIMQEFGETPYSRSNPYNYGADFGQGTGHHGLDIGLRAGTNLYAPMGGKIVIAGGSGYYKDDRYGNAPGTGEVRLRLDNGHEIILGHMGSINVRVGDRVEAGALLGQSGTASGDHLHLEYRIPAPELSGQQRAVDPRQYLR